MAWWYVPLTALLALVLRRLISIRTSDGTGAMRRRFTAFLPRKEVGKDSFVVFLIGARVNSWWTLLANLPAAFGFLKLGGPTFANAEVSRDKVGLLSVRKYGGLLDLLFGDGNVEVQYWDSFESLTAFNNNRHHAASRAQYYREAEATQAVSIWHETYIVRPGDYEAVYGNCPPIGLSAIRNATLVDVPRDSPLSNAKARREESSKH